MQGTRCWVLGAAAAGALACGIFAGAAAMASGGVWHDDDHHFTVELPDAWGIRPAEEVEEMNAGLRAIGQGGALSFVAKFSPLSAANGETPFAAMQWMPLPTKGTRWADVAASLRQTNMKEINADLNQKISSIGAKLETGTLAIDDARRCYTMRMTLEGDKGRIVGLCTGFLGVNGVAQLNCYAAEDKFEASRPTFESFIDTFRYDAGHEYEEASFFSLLDWDSVLGKAMIGGLIGAGVAIVVAIGRSSKKSGTKRGGRRPVAGRRAPRR